MKISLKRSFAALTFATIATFGLAACGASTVADDVAVDQPDSAPQPQIQEPSPAPEPSESTSVGAATGSVDAAEFFKLVGDATADKKSSTVTIESSFSGISTTITADTITPDDPTKSAMNMTMDLGALGGTIELILVDGRVYMNMGELTQNKWVDMTDEGGDEIFAEQFDQLDTSTQFDIFEQSVKSIAVADQPETNDGVQAYRYDMVLDSAKLFELTDQTAEITAAGGAVPDDIRQSMWVTADGLPVKLEQLFDIEIAGTTASSSTVMLFSNWGESFTITAPSADQIVSPDALRF